MKLSPDLEAWLYSQGFDDSATVEAIEGGCISDAFRVSNGRRTFFVKQKLNAPSNFFEAEAEGLSYLWAACNLPTPKVHRYGKNFIALDYVSAGAQRPDFWQELARLLATLHQCTREQFGFINNNFIGESVQSNAPSSNGYDFFAEQRLIYQAKLAQAAGYFSLQDLHDVETIAAALPRLVPEQAASLLHGDLWSGNIHVSSRGEPVFIDPAVYYGWAEADLAMTLLFGGFPESFYEAYEGYYRLEKGWKDRADIYNLYHLMNHLNLFGSSYYAQVRRIIDRYSK